MTDVITIYTDGGARGNGKEVNIGGWGVVLEYKGHIKELYEGERNTTNNIQELKGVIKALEALKTTHIPVRIHCDSAYVVKNFNESLVKWKKKNWKKSDGNPVKNLELWKQLDKLVGIQDDCLLIKVKGHADNEGNNRADELANKAMDEVI